MATAREQAREFVHEYNGRWIVGRYDENDGRYYIPQRSDVQKLTGCHTTYGPLSYGAGDGYSYSRKSRAIDRAIDVYMLWDD